MRFRWSNLSSRAFEFECDRETDFEAALCDAYIEFRRGGADHAELHVLVAPGHWADPLCQLSSPTHYAGGISDSGSRYTHVYYAPDNHDAIPRVTGKYGADIALRIGPGAWNAATVWQACARSKLAENSFRGFVGGIVETVREEPDDL